MKKILMLAIISIALFSCKKDNDSFVTEISHSVKVTYGEAYNNTPAPNAKVVFHHKISGVSKQVVTGSDGEATLTLPAGTYRVSVEKNVTEAEMEALSGIATETVFTAAIENVTISSQQNVTTELKMKTSRVGELVIKQIYYAASDTNQGANYRDQFFEIHNNSNETIYLDKLCFAQLHGVVLIQKDAQNVLPSGQIDWSKSPSLAGMGEVANTDYVYSANVYSFPGTGKDYPLESGKSVIVAKTAQNHKAPLKIGDITYQVPNPDLTVDLSKAHFEIYFADDVEKNKTDIDNPNVPNMNIAYKTTTYKDLALSEIGRDAFAIFYTTDKDINVNYKRIQSPEIRRGKMSNRLYLQIPNSVIIDGVNLQAIDGAELPHRLPESIDAGQIKLTKGPKTSESAIRKEVKRIGNRVFYQDTNNSVNDFLHIDIPNTDSLNP